MTQCSCDVVIEVWNSEPKEDEGRVNWLKNNVPQFMAQVNKYWQDGELWYSLQCNNCGRIIHVPH